MSIKQEIREIFRKAEHVFGAQDSLGTYELVPFCYQIVDIASKNAGNIEFIEEVFKEDFCVHHECSWELAQVTMYHLKLPGFKCFLEAELEKATNDNDHRKIPVIHNILSAYVTPWVDFDLFYEQRS